VGLKGNIPVAARTGSPPHNRHTEAPKCSAQAQAFTILRLNAPAQIAARSAGRDPKIEKNSLRGNGFASGELHPKTLFIGRLPWVGPIV